MAVITKQQTKQRRDRLATISIINLAALLFLVLCEFVIAEHTWLTTLLTYMPQQPFVLPAVVLLIIALVKRRWRLALVNGLAAVFCLFVLIGFSIPRPAFFAHGDRVRVMTLNVHHLSEGTDAAMALIEREKPDVLCLQEVNQSHTDPVARIARRLPGWHVARAYDVAILTPLPISMLNVFPVKDTQRAMLETVLTAHGKRFAVLNIHMSTSPTPTSLMTRGASRRAHLRLTAAIRGQQVRQILAVANQTAYPMIVAGDFNTPPRGIFYRRLRGRFTDTFTRAGWGTGYTFPAKFPVMRIDYVFANKGFTAVKSRSTTTKASDHHAVVADLMLRE